MAQFTAEYQKISSHGTGVCAADSIENLFATLSQRGYVFRVGEQERITEWGKGEQKKYYGIRLTIRRGELEMTDYTSF